MLRVYYISLTFNVILINGKLCYIRRVYMYICIYVYM